MRMRDDTLQIEVREKGCDIREGRVQVMDRLE